MVNASSNSLFLRNYLVSKLGKKKNTCVRQQKLTAFKSSFFSVTIYEAITREYEKRKKKHEETLNTSVKKRSVTTFFLSPQ